MRNLIVLLMCLLVLGCKTRNNENSAEKDLSFLEVTAAKSTINEGDISLKIYDFDGLEPLLHIKDDKTYVINFWATWCKPCVEELPYFEKISKEFKNEGVEVVLISLDMPSMTESALLPFIRKNIKNSAVIMLDDPKMNRWIPKVDEEWGGAIPATLIFNKNKREFYESSFSYDELLKIVTNFNKN